MRKTILSFLLAITFSLNAQNPASVDLIIGSGFVGFHTITDIAVQSDGKIIVGGWFFGTSEDPTIFCKVIRYNSDGSIDTGFPVINFSENGDVQDIVVQPDGKILIGGNLTKMNNEYVGCLVRLNADGSKDTSFLASMYNLIYSIALQPDGKIIVGGYGTYEVNGHSQQKLVRLNTNGTIDNTFDLGQMAGFSQIYPINKVAIQPDGKILAGGSFTTFNGAPQGKLIRFNSDGTRDESFNIGSGSTDDGILADIIVLPNGKILICGGFGLWNGQAFGHLCKLNADGSLDTSFVNMFNTMTDVDGPGEIELQSDGKIVAIGAYTLEFVLHTITRFNSDGSQDLAFTANADNSLNSLKLQADDKIILGGFMSFDRSDTIKNGIARLNTNGTIDTAFSINTGLNDEVNSIALQTDNKTLLGGSFTKFNGVAQSKIIRVNDDGSKDSSFTIGTGFNGAVKSIAVQPDGKIIVGGSFTEFNGQISNYIIRLNNNGTRDTSFNVGAGFNNAVLAIQLQPDGKIIVGGSFTTFGGLQQNYLIRLNSDGTKDTNFVNNNAFDDKINSIALQPNGKIIVGGSFNEFNAQAQTRLIVLNGNGTKDTGFVMAEPLYNDVMDIAIQSDGKIIIAAYFVYRYNPDGSLDTNFNNNVLDLATIAIAPSTTIAVQENGQILVGGPFTVYHQRTNRIIRIK